MHLPPRLLGRRGMRQEAEVRRGYGCEWLARFAPAMCTTHTNGLLLTLPRLLSFCVSLIGVEILALSVALIVQPTGERAALKGIGKAATTPFALAAQTGGRSR